MAREIVHIAGLTDHLPLTVNQIYKLTKLRENPLPYKKCGKRLMFDLERVYRWFDSLPGRDETDPF